MSTTQNSTSSTTDDNTTNTGLRSSSGAKYSMPFTKSKFSPEALSYTNEEVLLEPYLYLLQVPGKQIRKKLIAAFNYWLKVPDDVVEKLSEIIQMLHTASLLIDDIEDNSKMRRGIPVAHEVYGVPWTINCANYCYFVAMHKCNQLGKPEATNIFLEEMMRLHWGQGFEIFWRDNSIPPSEDDYLNMVGDKTGGLFRLSIKMLQVFSEDKRDYTPLVNALGQFFQIRDDYLNVQSEEYMQNKSFCEDLTEGKFSFPIIHCINSNPSDHRMLNILKKRTEDVAIKKYAVDFMKETGSLEYSRKKMMQLSSSCYQLISDLGGNEYLFAIVKLLSKIDDDKKEAVPNDNRPKPALRLSLDE